MFNPFNSSQNPNYSYTPSDVSIISSHLSKTFLPDSFRILSVPVLQPNKSLPDLLKDSLQKYLQNRSVTFLPLNFPVPNNWTLLCFIPQESTNIILCKDPHGISDLSEELRTTLERLVPNINFITNESSELSEDSANISAILTLQNIKIITSNLQSSQEKFINHFSAFKDFATQEQADYLRKEEFPKRYREAITNEEDIRNIIKRHHRQELHKIQDLLSSFEYPQGTPLNIQIETPEALIKQQQENTIIIDLAINMTTTSSSKEYSYNYIFTFSQNLNSQSFTTLVLEKLSLPESSVLFRSENLIEVSSQYLSEKTPKLSSTASHLKWHELDLQAKRDRLCELNPRTPAQFKEITQNPNVQIEASELLKEAIQFHDAQLTKAILKAGIKVNDGCRFEGVAKVSFQVILQHELDQNPHLESLLKIKRLLAKYGCQGKLSDSQDQEQLKQMSYERIITQLAQNNDTESEVYEEFIQTLKSRLMISIIGLQSAASGKVALAENEIIKHIKEHFTEVALEHVLHEVMHKVPILGALVNASIEEHKHHHEVHDLLEKITGCFPDTKSMDRVIGDYSLGVLKYDAEGILAAINEGEEAKLKKVHKYADKFLKYFMDGKATKNNEILRNLGVHIAKDLLEDLKIHEKDLKEIEPEFGRKNCEIFAKLANYLDDVDVCKNLLKTYLPTVEKIFQIDSMPDVKSLIIMTKNHHAIFCFSSIAAKKDFQSSFYSQALYMDQENQEIGLERLIDEEHAIRLRASQIHVIGYHKGGNYLATELCQQVLSNIGAEKIHLYTCQDFHQNIIKKASSQILPPGPENLEIPSLKEKITLAGKELEIDFTDITRPAMTVSQLIGEMAKRESIKLQRLKTYAKAFNHFGLHQKIFEIAPLDRDNVAIVKFLQEKGANFNCRDCAGCTPLGYAAMHGHLDIVKSLVEIGTDYNVKDHQGASPLSAAAFHGNIDVVKYLVEKGANIENKDKEGDTPLGDAIASGSMSIVKYLLDQGAAPFRNIGCKKVPIFESDPRPQVKYFQILRKLKDQALTFAEYQDFVNEAVIKSGNSLYAFMTYFVSECIRLEHTLRSKQFDLVDTERQAWAQYHKKKLAQYLEQFFNGSEKLQAYNQAIGLLLGSRTSRQKKVLAICEDPQNQEDHDFKILKALIHLNRANSEFITPVKRRTCLDTTLKIINELKSSLVETPDLSYLEGEYHSVSIHPEKAREFYEKAALKDKNFMHPVARMVSYHMKHGEIERAHKEFKQVKKQILSIDVEAMLEDIMEVMATKEFMTLQAQKTLAEQDFSQSLKEALVIDVKESANELKKLIPAKLSAKHGSLFKTLDYASSMLQSFCWGIFSSTSGENPETKDHKFFDSINLLIKKFKDLKQEAKKTCSVKGSFNGDEQAEARFYEIIQEIIEYYESYINDIVKDCHDLHDPNYLKKFNSGRAEQFDVNKCIKVTSEKGKKFLLKKLASQFINLEVPKGDQKYGVHKVVVYPRDKDHQVYYKFAPYAPGLEFAVSSLYSQIVPNTTPETHLLSITEGKKTVLYQASKGIIGINFAEVISQQDLIQKIDMKNFSGLLISSLLARPGDAKPDNFVVKFTYDLRGIKSAQLVSVDNDIAFCREKLSVNSKGNTIYSDMLNILYLLPQMDKPISPFIRSYLLQQSPEVIISRWLQSLHMKNLQYLSSGFSTHDLEKALLPIKLPPATAKRIYFQLCQILALLKSETITHHEIFKAVYPSICDFYKKSRDSVGMVNSLKNLYKAAGADPNLVKLLYSHEKSVSSKAWTTFSMSKRKTKKEFDQVFSQDIVQSAQEFLADIDFSCSLMDSDILTELGQNLNFLTEITLYKISSAQLQKLCKHMTKLTSVTLINPQDKEECKALIKKTFKFDPEISFLASQILTNEPQELSIQSLWDLVDDKKRPADSILTAESVMHAIKQHSLNINEQDPKTKNTVLHQAVLRRDQKLVKILLDCGINYDLKNEEGNAAISLTTIPEIKLVILEHRLDYLWGLVKDGRYEEVKMIAETISGGRLGDYMNHIIEGEPKNLLEISLKDPKLKDLALVVLNKIDSRVNDRGLVKICVENYDDKEVGLLQSLIDKMEDDIPAVYKGEEESLIKQYTEAANQAYESQKWNMLVFLTNRGCQLTIPEENIRMIMKAREWGIVIDSTDFKNQFDYTKQDLQGNLIFHMMCEHCDLEVFRYYKDILPRYFNVKNKQGEDLQNIARKKGFIEVLELIYPDQKDEGLYDKDGHILSQGVTKKLSKILKGYGITITIREALGKIDLNKVTDEKGNSYLQQVIKRYIKCSADLVKCKGLEGDLKVLLQNGANVQGTKRLDGNSALHLAAKYGQANLMDSLICYAQAKELGGVNAWQQTALDVAEIYGHEETAVVIRNWIKELREI